MDRVISIYSSMFLFDDIDMLTINYDDNETNTIIS